MDYLLLFLIGITATTLGTLAGGGGLISLPSMLLLGMPIHSAIGANKVSNTVSSFSSFYVLLRQKHLSLKESIGIVPISLAGGVSGGYIASLLSEERLYWVAIALLIFAFISSFLSKKSFEGGEAFQFSKKSVTGLYGIGIYDGMFGPGQGTLMLYLFNYLNVSYIKAVGYVRLATFSSCFGASISYIMTGKILWGMTLALMAGSVSGAQIGVRLAQILPTRYVKIILRVVTFAIILQLIYRSL